jgi:hypothetical protein
MSSDQNDEPTDEQQESVREALSRLRDEETDEASAGAQRRPRSLEDAVRDQLGRRE